MSIGLEEDRMRILDFFRNIRETGTKGILTNRYTEDARLGIKGEFFLESRDSLTGEVKKYHWKNIITTDASILIARLVKDSLESPHGAYVLAIGSGDSGWDLQHPPAATATQRSLYAELARKRFTSTAFISSGGVPVAYPTHVVDFTTTFTESEAVGPWVEMGIIGGNISSNMSARNPVSPPNGTYDATVDLSSYETMLNYLTFPVINKPATATYTLTWRLTF
jgi:hypothetical protein